MDNNTNYILTPPFSGKSARGAESICYQFTEAAIVAVSLESFAAAADAAVANYSQPAIYHHYQLTASQICQP